MSEEKELTIEELRFCLHAADDTYDQKILAWLQETPNPQHRTGDNWAYFSSAMTEGAYKRLVKSWLEELNYRLDKKENVCFEKSPGAAQPWHKMSDTRPDKVSGSTTIWVARAAYDRTAEKLLMTQIVDQATERARFCIEHVGASDENARIEAKRSFLSFGKQQPRIKADLAVASDNRCGAKRRIASVCRYMDNVEYWLSSRYPHKHIEGLSRTFQRWVDDQYTIFLLRALLGVPGLKHWPQVAVFNKTGLSQARKEPEAETSELT